MLWTPLAAAIMLASSFATAATTVSLRRHWDLHISSVRWLFILLFLYLWLWSSSRTVYCLWMWMRPADDDDEDTSNLNAMQLDQLVMNAILHLPESGNGWVSAVLCFGDAALFGVALWMIPLMYELSKIAANAMDRGVERERKKINLYYRVVHVGVAIFAVTEISLAIAFGGYSHETHKCLFLIYALQLASVVYSLFLLIKLNRNGRKYENVHGQFMASPIYQRLKRILLIYALFSLQFQVCSFVLYAVPTAASTAFLTYFSISLLLYHATPFMLSIATSCSQFCVLRTCSCCMPSDLEAQCHSRLMHYECEAPPLSMDDDANTQGNAGQANTSSYVPPTTTNCGTSSNKAITSTHSTVSIPYAYSAPRVNPVFVFTDIESSSELWAIGDGRIMQRATELHDDILRSSLMKHRGYEITTCGDSFQLAFHTIREAVEYCLDIQFQLLAAPWPKDMHNLIPATQYVKKRGRLLFSGLRVRMGIHDAADADGPLVHNTHAVTGKMTYTGAAEVIAHELGDLGSGGQILVTQRIAEWVKAYEDLLAIDCAVEHVGDYSIPALRTHLEIFQLSPMVLVGRKKTFAMTLRRRVSSVSFFPGTPSTISNSSRQRLSSYEAARRLSRHSSQMSVILPETSSFYQRATSM